MLTKNLFSALAAIAAVGALAGPALAQGGVAGGGGTGGGGGTATGGGGTATGGGGAGGGGGTTTALPAPPIAPATFAGIGPGPVYAHESFGFWYSGTRYRSDGKVVSVNGGDAIAGIRAEYPNNQAESWIGPNVTSGALRWQWATVGPSDEFEPYTMLQDSTQFGYNDGLMMVVGEPGAPQTRPDALLPFPAPTTSPSTVSADSVGFLSRTAIGFSNSSATNSNFETNGLVWLELDSTNKNAPATRTWTFHTNGLSGATITGTSVENSSGRTRVAVSYDPVNHIAEATIDGNLVASAPYTAPAIKYVGAEGNTNADVDNFSVWSGAATDPMPDAVAAPATPATTKF
jgi:hypothetical protein